MRKIILFNLISLDGYFEGPKKWDINWHRVDEEFNSFSLNQLDQADGLLFGRVTYEGMASYWPTANAIKNDPQVAESMNTIRKYVFSKTLDQADWNNTQLINGDAVAEITRLKNQPGKDLYLFGSAILASTLINHRLIDEFRIIVNPVVLGQGGPLFVENEGMLKLRLLDTRVFKNGNVLLYYAPDGMA